MKLKKKRIALIGLPVLQSVNNLSNAAIARHAEEGGSWRFVFSAEASVEAFRFLRTLDCDGAIVRIMNTAMLREAKKIQFPLVNVSSWLEKPGVPTVRHDYAAVGRMAAEYLLEKGFRRFGCVVVPGGWFLQQRHNALVRAVHEHGASLKTFHLQSTMPDVVQPLSQAERRRFIEWLRTLQRPAALVLMDDWDAPILMELCREAGYEVPRDLVMITTGCHSEVLPLCRVPLTAVQEDQELQARLAVGCLDVLMADKQPRETMINVPPLGIAERTSTATMAIEDREVAHAVEFIRGHGFEPINVADVSSRVQVARVTLERRFRQLMGKTMHEYLTELRVRRAKELLISESPPSLQSIAQQCGLADRRRLNQVFISVAGVTPTAWQQANR
ncbi:MAG: substrate-binding domain-containing protein, partial [Verrucomicrobiota bacterium]